MPPNASSEDDITIVCVFSSSLLGSLVGSLEFVSDFQLSGSVSGFARLWIVVVFTLPFSSI